MPPDSEPIAGSNPLSADPAAVPGPSEQPSRRIDITMEDPAEPAEFDRVLADIAGRLSNAPDGQFDQAVTGCLQALVEFLGFDRSTLMAFSERGSVFRATHSWAVEGVPAAPGDVLLNAKLPWFTRQIRSGHVVSISSSIDLPAVAAQERSYLLRSGLKSVLGIPLLMEGAIVGAMSFSSFHRQRRWSLGLVSRLRLAGEILAMGMRRHQYAQSLEAIAQTMGRVLPEQASPDKKTARHFRDRAMRLLQAEHQERRRMGQVLHEDVMQILSAVGMFVQSGKNDKANSTASDKALALLKDALEKLRRLTLELRPEAVFEMTLADGMRWLADQMRRRYDLNVDVRLAKALEPVDDDLRCFLYDSARKLLENVAHHASCPRATLEIRRGDPNVIQLIVSDEGIGFNPDSLQDLPGAAFGLFSIREQLDLFGGTLEVTSSPGLGTTVAIGVPAGP